MAQRTSELWKALWRMKGTSVEYAFDIDGTRYGPECEVSHTVDGGLFEQFGIGGAVSATLTLSLFAAAVPQAATIRRYARLRNEDQVSEWLPKGVFLINRRNEEDGYWTIEAFDAMRKAEIPWVPEQAEAFPMPAPEAVEIFARAMGVEIDPRTQLDPAYTIDHPASNADSETGDYYSIRQELKWIAAAHAGNWIITGEGKLLLVPLLSVPKETSYLVTEYGGAITLGGIRIHV